MGTAKTMSQASHVERNERIRAWMKEVIERRSHQRYDDLHLDRIDPEYARPLTWLTAGAACLDAAISIRDDNRWPFSVALGMSLKAGPERIGRNFNDYQHIVGEFDWTPPSLYVFPKGEHSWLGGPELEELGPEYRAPTAAPNFAFFREWYDANDQEYRRSLWFIG